jgi:hypothetical protein
LLQFPRQDIDLRAKVHDLLVEFLSRLLVVAVS